MQPALHGSTFAETIAPKPSPVRHTSKTKFCHPNQCSWFINNGHRQQILTGTPEIAYRNSSTIHRPTQSIHSRYPPPSNSGQVGNQAIPDKPSRDARSTTANQPAKPRNPHPPSTAAPHPATTAWLGLRPHRIFLRNPRPTQPHPIFPTNSTPAEPALNSLNLKSQFKAMTSLPSTAIFRINKQ